MEIFHASFIKALIYSKIIKIEFTQWNFEIYFNSRHFESKILLFIKTERKLFFFQKLNFIHERERLTNKT